MNLSGAKGNLIEIPEELLSFYTQLASLQDEMYTKVSLPETPVSENEIQQHQRERKSWIQLLKFPQITEGFQHNLQEIVDFTINFRPQIKEQIEAIMAAVKDEDPLELIQKTLWLDAYYFENLSEKRNLSAGVLVFLMENALRPYLRAWGQGLLKHLDKEQWLRPYCPICSQKADISRLRQGDGSRMLFCSHCFTEWQYRHLFCPHCENDDPMTLNIITIEGNDLDQIYTCDKCKGYLKTINEKKQGFESNNMLVESARTFFLDMLADREGYTNPSADRAQLN
jgi:FdhE protein